MNLPNFSETEDSAAVADSAVASLPAPHQSSRSADDDGKEATVHQRFDRVARLYGEQAVLRLAQARVAVFGVGGVGSFAAEALARSGVGHIRLVDFDKVCVTNTNRQLQALASTTGRPKAALLAARLRDINPDATVEAVREFYDEEHADVLLATTWPGATNTFDYVIDCIDSLSAKAHLIATCRGRGIPIVAAMGAGGKTDPTRIRVTDLGRTEMCPLAHQLRKCLRQKHGFARERNKMGVLAVFSDEPRRSPLPLPLPYDQGSTGGHACAHDASSQQGRTTRRVVPGTAVFVTGAFGLCCAGVAVNALIANA